MAFRVLADSRNGARAILFLAALVFAALPPSEGFRPNWSLRRTAPAQGKRRRASSTFFSWAWDVLWGQVLGAWERSRRASLSPFSKRRS